MILLADCSRDGPAGEPAAFLLRLEALPPGPSFPVNTPADGVDGLELSGDAIGVASVDAASPFVCRDIAILSVSALPHSSYIVVTYFYVVLASAVVVPMCHALQHPAVPRLKHQPRYLRIAQKVQHL